MDNFDPSSYTFEHAKEEFERLINSGYQQDEYWEEFISTSNSQGDISKAWRQQDKESGLYLYRIYGVLKGVDYQNFIDFYKDYEYRLVWDPYSSQLDKIDEVDGSDDEDPYIVIKWRIHISFPFISDREYCFKRRDKFIEDIWVILDQTVEHEKAVLKKNPVRIGSYNCAITIKKEGDDLVLYQNYLTALDFKMSLPKWLLNWASGSGVKNLMSLYREHATKYPKYLEKKENKQTK